MTIVYDKETIYDRFIGGLTEFPFVRVAIFCTIAGTVFHLLGIEVISKLLFYIVPLAIIARVSSFFLAFPTHFLSRFSVICIFVAAEIEVVNGILNSLILKDGVRTTARIAVPILGHIVWVIMVLAVISFLIRIFIALFIH